MWWLSRREAFRWHVRRLGADFYPYVATKRGPFGQLKPPEEPRAPVGKIALELLRSILSDFWLAAVAGLAAHQAM